MSQEKAEKREVLGKIDFVDFVENLPIGAYKVDNDGIFVYCNDTLAEILGYPKASELIGKRIGDFYLHPEDRIKLLGKMKREKSFVNETLYWRDKNDLEICISDSCKFLFGKDGKPIGVMGVIRDVWYRKLFDSMNAGIYKIGSDLETIVKVNPAVANIFGYSVREMEGMGVKRLYKNPDDMEKLKLILLKEGKIKNYTIEMVKRNGEKIVVSVNATLIKGKKGIIGREGTFTDITEEYKIRNILEEMPTGAYQVKIEGDKKPISYCNKAFATMFGYDSPRKVIGMDVRIFYAKQSVVDYFERELIEADYKGMPLLDYRLRVKKKNGERFWVEIDSHLLKDHKQKIIGRQGTLRDATIKIQLEEILRRREDIQRFSHRFMAPILSIKTTSDVFIEELEREMEFELSDEKLGTFRSFHGDLYSILNVIYDLTEAIIKDILELIELITWRNENGISEEQLEEFVNRLKGYVNRKRIENIIEIREIQRLISQYLLSFSEDSLGNRMVVRKRNKILDDLVDVDKFYILYLAQTINNTSKIAYTDVENLRSYLLRWDEKGPMEFYKPRMESLCECLAEVINIYQVYAIEKGITIEKSEEFIPPLKIAKENIKMMFHYLIQNAVKYSFKRKGYIRIKCENLPNNVKIDIENFGVGILPEEIESDKIFEYGYRGKYSTDFNRTGSGIGLSEALQIARKHGGVIKISSMPVRVPKKGITKDTPFVTKVSIIIPKSRKL